MSEIDDLKTRLAALQTKIPEVARLVEALETKIASLSPAIEEIAKGAKSRIETVGSASVGKVEQSLEQALETARQAASNSEQTKEAVDSARRQIQVAIDGAKKSLSATAAISTEIKDAERAALVASLNEGLELLRAVLSKLNAEVKGEPQVAAGAFESLKAHLRKHGLVWLALLFVLGGFVMCVLSLSHGVDGVKWCDWSLSQLNARILSRALLFAVSWFFLGAGAALFRGASADGESNVPFRALKYGAAAVLASATVLTGAKVTETFTIADGPQVVFVGSGTVHRFLFSAAHDLGDLSGLEVPQGRALGKHGVRLWSFESGSYDGIGLLTYAYGHHGNGENESRVALVAMSSADTFETTSDGGFVLRESERKKIYDTMRTDNIAADDFLVLPLVHDIVPTIYCPNDGGFCPNGGELYVQDAGTAAEREGAYACDGVAATQFDFFLAGHSGATGAVLAPWTGECLKGGASSSRRLHNFSLDLSHVDARVGLGGLINPIALGNLAESDVPGWKKIACSNCRKRDLSLLLPLSRGVEINPFTCMALRVLADHDKLAALKDYIEFSTCEADAKDCKCTPKGRAKTDWVLTGLAERD